MWMIFVFFVAVVYPFVDDLPSRFLFSSLPNIFIMPKSQCHIVLYRCTVCIESPRKWINRTYMDLDAPKGAFLEFSKTTNKHPLGAGRSQLPFLCFFHPSFPQDDSHCSPRDDGRWCEVFLKK